MSRVASCLLALQVILLLAFGVVLHCPHACCRETILPDDDVRWAIALHGGAGRLEQPLQPQRRAKYEESLTKALKTGRDILAKGGTALDAVEATVIVLEDDPLFNAGKGSAFTKTGEHELDASIMDGATLQCGGVAMVRKIKNPIKAARLVMTETPHVLLCGSGAEKLAKQHACDVVEQNYFFTRRRFEKLRSKLDSLGLPPPEKPGYPLTHYDWNTGGPVAVPDVHGTVGCVALDRTGKMAAATSTGGLTGKMPGRIGDSPINGAGNYANQDVAVSGTGKGEQFIRHTIASRVAWLVKSSEFDVEQAVKHCLLNVLEPNDGGLIAVDRQGKLVLYSTTGFLPRGAADSSGRFEIGISLSP